MKLKTFPVLCVAVVAGFLIGVDGCDHSVKEPTTASGQTIAYYTCPMHPSVKADKPGSCPICSMNLTPVYEKNVATRNASASTTNQAPEAAKPYPFDICLVDGMKLGSMGDPYVFVYQGQEIKFCCAACKPAFLKDPDKYLKKIQDAVPAAKL